MNIRLIAVEAGDALKYATTVNEIDRIASAVFPFAKPALHWPITEQDAVDILSFISFLFRQLDKAVKHP